MPPSPDPRHTPSGRTGFRRVSALKLIPAPTRSFARRFVLPTFGVLSLALVGVATAGLLELRSAVRRDVRERATLVLESRGDRILLVVSPPQSLARRLAHDPGLLAAIHKARGTGASDGPLTSGERTILERHFATGHLLDPGGESSRILRETVASLPGILGAWLFDANGVAIAGSGPASLPFSDGEAWFQGALRASEAVRFGPAATGAATGTLVVAAAVPDGGGKTPAGVVEVLVSLDGLKEAIRLPDRTETDGYRLALADGSGKALTTSGAPPAPLTGDPDFTVPDRAGRELVPTASGRFVLGVPRADVGAGWSLVVSIPGAALEGPVRNALLWRVTVVFLALVCAAAAFVPAFRSTRRDLTALLDYARRIGGGETGATPPAVKRSDEIGALGAALVGSLESLRSSRVELERAKKTLEERVDSRTSELARVNQELKRRAEELAAASKSKDDFLTNISHELRTPLNSIIGLTQLVRDGHADAPEEQAVFLDQALASARHLLTLINDVLDLAKLEAGRVVLELEPLDVRQVFEEVRPIVEPLALEKRLAYEMSVPPDLPAALADRMRLRQVLVNLTQNAIKFTETGRVLVRARSSDGRRKVLFEVEDTGIGISPQKRSAVFEKFIQAEAGTTRRYGGTGLGLPICRLLVEAMGGKIGIENGAQGRGTRVWFTVATPGMEGR